MGSLFFIVWITAAGVQAQGITSGSLGHQSEYSATLERACATLATAKKREAGAKLYRIDQGQHGTCDYGCEFPVSVQEIACIETEMPHHRLSDDMTVK